MSVCHANQLFKLRQSECWPESSHLIMIDSDLQCASHINQITIREVNLIVDCARAGLLGLNLMIRESEYLTPNRISDETRIVPTEFRFLDSIYKQCDHLRRLNARSTFLKVFHRTKGWQADALY